MSADGLLTIAGRWRAAVAASGIDKALPKRELSLAMTMFYAGFSACLEAEVELADLNLPDEQAAQILQALHNEIKQVEAMTQQIVGNVKPS